MGLKGINVNGMNYAMDYNYLENKPNVPYIPTVSCGLDVDNYYTTLVAYSTGNEMYYDWCELIPRPLYSSGTYLTYGNDGEIKWGNPPESTQPSSGGADGSGVPQYHGDDSSMGYSMLAPEASDSFVWRSLDEAIEDMVYDLREDDPQHDDATFLYVNHSGSLMRCEGTVVPVAGCSFNFVLYNDESKGLTWGPVDDLLSEYAISDAINDAIDLNNANSGDVLTAVDIGNGMKVTTWERPIPECYIGDGAVLYAGDSYGSYEWASVDDIFSQSGSVSQTLVNELGGRNDGHVLVSSGNGTTLAWSDVDHLLGANKASAGNVLAVDSYGSIEWVTPSSGGESLPSRSASDSGKVLTVSSAGGLVWRTPSSTSGESLPDHSTSDSGKVLTVNSAGGLVWRTPASSSAESLPNHSSYDSGKVLTVDSTGGIAWRSFSGQLPTCYRSDSGKVLAVNNEGTATWTTMSEAITESVDYNGGAGVLTKFDDGTIGWSGQQLPAFSSTALGSVMYADEYTDKETGEVVQVPRWGSVAIALGELDGGHDGDGDRVLMISGGGQIYWGTLPESN